MTALLELAEQRLPDIIDDALALIEVESPSNDLDAVARSAKATADLVRERLGAAAESIVIEGRTHLLASFGTSPTQLMLLGHHDAVWPIGTLTRLPATVADGALRGPGGLDMKLGVVQAVHALALVRDVFGVGALDGVTLLVTGDEEIGSPTSRALIEKCAAGAVLVLEAGGDNGELKTDRKGVSLYRAQVSGRAAHAGLEPEKGINAAVEIAHLVIEIAAMSAPDLGTTLTPTVLSAGTTTNTVPAEACVDIDVRARSAAEHVALQNDLTPPAGIAVGGASDGNFTAGLGIPTLDGLGGVGGGAHAETEHARISAIVPRTVLLAGMIRSITTEGISRVE